MGFLNRRPSILVKSASKIRLPRKLSEFYHGSWRIFGTAVGGVLARKLAQLHAARNPPQPSPARSRTLYSACPVLRLKPHPLCVAADAAACSSRSMVQVAIGSKRMQSAAASRQPATRFIWGFRILYVAGVFGAVPFELHKRILAKKRNSLGKKTVPLHNCRDDEALYEDGHDASDERGNHHLAHYTL